MQLSAFADEISPRLEEQISVLRAEGIRYLDLRSVDGVNVLDFSDAQVMQMERALADGGVRVAAIGSPIGKVPIDAPFDEHLARFERALALAEGFDTRFVRIFSFYGPAGAGEGWPDGYRGEVITRLQAMTERARARDIVLVHENEKDIYGDTVHRCVDLLQTVADSHFRAAFDPANFIQCGQTPYPIAYDALRAWIGQVHVKDALTDGQVVPAGDGVARWPEILAGLRKDGYDGFLSLEPHLASGGRYGGFSGPERFHRAVSALTGLLDSVGWEYER